MSKASFRVYIDEAGDEGFRFERRTPEWFIISAAITRVEHDLETLTGILRPIRELFGLGAKDSQHEIAFLEAAKARDIALPSHFAETGEG